MKIVLELTQKESEAIFELAKTFTVDRLQTANIGAPKEPISEPIPQVVETPTPVIETPVVQMPLAVTSASPVVDAPVVSLPENYSPLPVVTSAPIIPQPQPQPELAAPSTIVPVTAATYSMEQLAVAATQLVDAGRRQELIGLLGSFGVQALTTLPKEQYGAFATQLRAMGAKL